MTARKIFEEQFSEDNLKQKYEDHVLLSGATGIDHLTHQNFWANLDQQIFIASSKVLNGSYKITKYKLKLISKGRGKVPRVISIPTIRDRVVLRALCDFLAEIYDSDISFKLPQSMVKAIKQDISSGHYDGFIKLDVSDFYPSIVHSEILRRLRGKIRDNQILNLIENALQTPTVIKSSRTDVAVDVGVPQGLAISNILSTIYLLNIDKIMKGISGISYYRYVDDIFVLCNNKDVSDISQDLIRRFRWIGLTIHDPESDSHKSTVGKLGEKFDYLGYTFEGARISPKEASIEKLKDSLVSIFTSYKHSRNRSKNILLWRINLRITGCVFQNKRRGWMFFFSEINNETILHVLDKYVTKLENRFGVSISPKRFVRVYHEIRHHKYETKYIPNFDSYSLDQMKELLVKYFNVNLSLLRDDQVEYEFKKKIDKQVRELLTDVQDVS